MKPTRKEIEQIARHLRRVTKKLPNPIMLARHLQTSYEMNGYDWTDDEFIKCLSSCRSVLRMLSAESAKPVARAGAAVATAYATIQGALS